MLGQLRTAEKSNEITAIPLLLELLELKGCIVTIDAIGCQREVAAKIISEQADYVLSLKGNQGLLHEEVAEYFAWAEAINFKDLEYDYCATLEKDHGRIEGRWAWLYAVLKKTKAKVIVCTPRKNRLLHDGNKSDKVAAEQLAPLLRAGLLSALYHGEHGVRDPKALVRSYEYLVADSTRVMNRTKALYRRRAIACAGTGGYKQQQREAWLG